MEKKTRSKRIFFLQGHHHYDDMSKNSTKVSHLLERYRVLLPGRVIKLTNTLFHATVCLISKKQGVKLRLIQVPMRLNFSLW